MAVTCQRVPVDPVSLTSHDSGVLRWVTVMVASAVVLAWELCRADLHWVATMPCGRSSDVKKAPHIQLGRWPTVHLRACWGATDSVEEGGRGHQRARLAQLP